MKIFFKITNKLGYVEILVDDEDAWLLEQYSWNVTNRKGVAYVEGMNAKTSGPYRNQKLHRVIMQPGVDEAIDHINGNGLDNRRSNLRICQQRYNVRNARKRSTATTFYKGVSYNSSKKYRGRKRWVAQIQKDKKKIFLGWYSTAEEAAHAYDSAAKIHFGEFAVLNFPSCK